VILFEPESHLPWIAVVALLADRLQIDLIELCLHRHLLVARRTSKVVHAPSLVECGEDVGLDDLVAHIAQVPEQLMVVGLTVGKAFPLVVAVSHERLLALGADEVFDAPMFPKCGDHPPLDRTSAGSADWDSHPVVASKAVQLVQLVCSVARPSTHLSGCGGEFLLAVGAGEVVRVVDLAAEPQRLTVYDGMALLAHVLPLSSRLYLGVAFMAEGSPLVLDEAKVRQFLSTHFAAEALWVPG